MKVLPDVKGATFLLALVLPYFYAVSTFAQLQDEEPVHLKAGLPAPEFGVAAMDGSKVVLSDCKGKVVLLEFWASWCPSCPAQVPRLVDLHRKFQRYGLQIIGVCLDEDTEAARRFLEAHPEIEWPQVVDDRGMVARAYGVKEIPRGFLLDWNGRIVSIHQIHDDLDIALLLCERIRLAHRKSQTKPRPPSTLYRTKPGPSLPARTIEFPTAYSMGRLHVRDPDRLRLSDPETPRKQGWKFLAEARGVVRIPKGTDANLVVGKDRWSDLSPLSKLGSDDLQKITLANAKLEGNQIEHLRKLTGLMELDLHGSSITDEDLADVGKLSSLRKLLLQDTAITDRGVADLRDLPSLEKLNLAGTGVTDGGVRYATGMPSLRWLNLCRTKVTESGLRCIPDAPRLEILQVSGMIRNDGLMHVSRSSTLRSLDITSPLLSDPGLAILSGMDSLESLSIGEARITNGGLEYLKSMKSLRYGWIHGRSRLYSPWDAVRLQRALPGCELSLL